MLVSGFKWILLMQATRPLCTDTLWERKLCSLWLRSPGRADGTGTPMSSDCNSFPCVCLVKKRQRLGGIGVDNPEGIGAVCLVCFFFSFLFFHPPSCAAVIASSLLLPAATERERETHRKTEKEREREKEP